MIKFLPHDFLSASYKIPWKNKNAVCLLQLSALVPAIFMFEKCVKMVSLADFEPLSIAKTKFEKVYFIYIT